MLAGRNLALITSRLTKGEIFAHTQVTRNVAEVICMSPKTSNNGFVFPLYLYHKDMFSEGAKPNLNPKFLEDIAGRLRLTFVPEGRSDLETTFGPEEVFYYAYAIFHAPAYRQRYVEFLRGDFPRLPLTGDKALFSTLVGQGAELAALHLLEAPVLEKLITSFSVPGSNLVDKVSYDEAARRVYINNDQYFEGVSPAAWSFQVGGYQVLHKWLKDRKGRTLAFADLHHYQKVVVALTETIRLMAEIDAAIDAHGGWPIDDGT
jgi:predicted helicase